MSYIAVTNFGTVSKRGFITIASLIDPYSPREIPTDLDSCICRKSAKVTPDLATSIQSFPNCSKPHEIFFILAT